MRNAVWKDVMQVCMNGHRITQYAASEPETRKQFCKECGAKSIDACEACTARIEVRHNSRFVMSQNVPKYCSGCGAPFPWQTAAIENLQEILRESELSDEELEEAGAALPDIVRDTPKTESASLKMKRLLGKAGKPVYDVAIKVISDVASETAKKTMGLK